MVGKTKASTDLNASSDRQRRSGRARQQTEFLTDESWVKKTPVASERLSSPNKKRAKKQATSPSRSRTDDESTGGARAEDPFLDAIQSGGALKVTAKEWIEQYEKNVEASLCDLVNLILHSCGFTESIPKEDFESDDPTEVIEAFIREGLDDADEAVSTKKVRKNIAEFFGKLTMETQTKILFDSIFAPTLLDWVIPLSSSKVRVVRLTATVSIYAILRSMALITSTLKGKVVSTASHLSEAKKKSPTSKKVTELQRIVEETSADQDTLEEMMQTILDGVFTHRYRDVDPDVRELSMSTLSYCMVTYPSFFLGIKQQKYFVWLINDKVPEVRLATVRGLIKLYENDENIPLLTVLSERGVDRFATLPFDKDAHVAVAGLTLFRSLYRHQAPISDKQIRAVSKQVFEPDSRIRSAAGKFVSEKLGMSDRDIASDGTEQLRYCVGLLDGKSAEEMPSCVAYLVDALWDNFASLADLKLFVNLLTNEDGRKNKVVSGSALHALAGLMHSSFKRLMGHEICHEDMYISRKFSKKEKSNVDKVKQESSLLVVKALPQLLTKFQSDAKALKYLVDLPSVLDLSVYADKRQKKNFEDLLKALHNVVEKHTDEAILSGCAATLAGLIKEQNTVLPIVEKKCSQMSQSIISNIQSCTSKLGKSKGKKKFDDEDEATLTANLVRLERLIAHLPIAEADVIYPLCFTILESKKCSEEIVLAIIKIGFLQTLHTFLEIEANRPSELVLANFIEHRNRFVSLIVEYLDDDVVDKISIVTYLSDVLVLFSNLEASPLEALELVNPEDLEERVSEILKQTMEDGGGEEQRKLLHALCRLALHGCVSVECAGLIVSFYATASKECQKVLGELLQKMKVHSAIDNVKVEHAALVTEFQASPEQARQLSDRLAKEYKPSKAQQNSPSLVKLLKDGFEFAIENVHGDNADFAATLMPYVPKMTASGAQQLASFLKQRTDEVEEPFVHTNSSIADFVTAVEKAAAVRRTRARLDFDSTSSPNKRRSPFGDDQSSPAKRAKVPRQSEDDDDDDDEDEEEERNEEMEDDDDMEEE